MRRLALLAVALAGCNAILGIDEPTLGTKTPMPDARSGELPDGPGPVTIQVTKTGSGQVTSDPAGIDCGIGCPSASAKFGRGQTVHLTATAGPGWQQPNWTSCPQVDGTVCTVDTSTQLPGALTVTFTPLGHNVVFTSSIESTGDLGGLAGADATCATLASNAGLHGTYVALLSTTTVSARDRLVVPGGATPARGFVRTDGLPIADTLTDWFDVHRQYYAPNLTESGKAVTMFQSWTGSTTTGTPATDDCGAWTRGDTAAAGMVGQAAGGPNLANVARVGCDAMNLLTCVGVDHTEAIAVPQPQAGKVAFLSVAAFAPNMGLAAANAICNGEKPASVSGPAIALLATSTRSAKSLLTGSYVRADGIPLDFFGPFGDTAEDTGLWVHGDGSYAKPAGEQTAIRVWNGSQLFGSTPAAASHTCGDWTTATGMGDVGFTSAGPAAWGGNKANCSQALPLYCVEM